MKISIAMAVYNGSKFIEKQLDSLRLQTLMPDEVIIFDDNSIDSTQKIIELYIEKWNLKGWKYFKNSKNVGWKKNFHLATGETTGDIVFYCDQDDIWLPDKIKKMIVSFKENPQIEVLACKLNLINIDGNALPDIPSALPFNSLQTGNLVQNPINTKFIYTIYPGCTIAIKRELINLITKCEGYDELAHDALYWKIGTLLNKAFTLDESLILYRIHDNNASNPSDAGKMVVKSIEQRLNEVETVSEMLYDLHFVMNQIQHDNVKQNLMILKQLNEFCIKRKAFLNKEINVLYFLFRFGKYYRNMRMVLGDLLCRISVRISKSEE
ncbi:TPA: glycosyltransferase [Streptococcus suis]